MKTKIFVVAIIFAFAANVYAQLEVNSSGDTYVGKDIFLQKTSGVNLTTINNVPISFKVNGTSLAGYTGYSGKTSVSFGCGASNSGYDNVAVGYRALYSNWGSSPFGDGNTAIGTNALYSNGEGAYNAATGHPDKRKVCCILKYNKQNSQMSLLKMLLLQQ